MTSAKGRATGPSQESLIQWFMHEESFVNGAQVDTEILRHFPDSALSKGMAIWLIQEGSRLAFKFQLI